MTMASVSQNKVNFTSKPKLQSLRGLIIYLQFWLVRGFANFTTNGKLSMAGMFLIIFPFWLIGFKIGISVKYVLACLTVIFNKPEFLTNLV